jgi:hypothetical protein
MKKSHPLDEAFRHKLRDFEAEVPMHLWGQIVQKRNWQHRFINRLKQQPPFAVLLSTLVVVGALWLVMPGQQVTSAIQSFPIPLPLADTPDAQATAAVSTKAALGSDGTVLVHSTPQLGHTPPQLGHTASAIVASARQAIQSNAKQLALPAAEPTRQLLLASSASSPTISPALSPPTPPLPTLLEQATAKRPGILSSLFSPDPKCAHFGTGPWRFYFDAILSPDLAIRTMHSTNPEYDPYIESRKETESYMYAFSGALRFSAVNNKGIAIRSGLNYSQINEKFNYFSGSEQIIKFISRFDEFGNVIGTDTVVEVGTRHKVTHNNYRMLDIPFLLGYEIGGNKLSISINGGAYLNLLFRQKGDFLSPQDMRPVRFDSSNPNAYAAFRQQVGLGWYGSMGFAFRASPKLQILVEPHFKIFPKPVTLDQFVLEQRYMTTGVFVGVRAQL